MSSQLFRLPTNLSPAPSTLQKAKKRIPRPSNCFIAYRMAVQHKILEARPNINSKEVSQIVGKMWRMEPEIVKNHFRIIAKEMKEEHANRYPHYSYNPKRRLGVPSESLETDDPQRHYLDAAILPRRLTRQSTKGIGQPKPAAEQINCDDKQLKYQRIESPQTSLNVWRKEPDQEDVIQPEVKGYEEGNLTCDYDSFPDIQFTNHLMDKDEESIDDETNDFSASSSSSQANLQDEDIGQYHFLFDDNDIAIHPSMLSGPLKWNEDTNDPLLPMILNDGGSYSLAGYDLPYISLSDNFDHATF